jgi:YVTN family beta-propeller protein
MRSVLLGRLALLAAASTCCCGFLTLSAQSPQRGSVLILSKRAHTLAIVDPASFKVLGRVPVGEDPHEVIASEDGRTAYVSNYGGGSLHTLAVIDLVNKKALPAVELGPLGGPHGLDAVGGKIWFTAEGAKVIGSYDPTTKKVDWVLGTGQNRTHMLWVSPDMERIVTTNVASGTVSVIDQTMRGGGAARVDWDETVVKVGGGAEGFDVSRDGKEAWVANAQDGTISIIDLTGKKVVQTLEANVRGANRLKFTLDGRMALVSSLGNADLVFLDVASRKVVKRLPIGHGAAGIVMQPDGKRAFVACSPDDYVVVIDLGAMSVVGKIDAGGEPDGMAWAVR